MRERTPVLVFGSGLTAIGVLRTLGRAGIPAFSVAAEHTSDTFLLKSRWYRPFQANSGPALKPDDLVTFLEGLSLKQAVLMPCADDWAKAVASLPPDLQRRFPASISPASVIATMVDKWMFAEMLNQEDVPHPRTSILCSLAEMEAVPESIYEGAFLKPLGSLEFVRRHKVKGFIVSGKQDALKVMASSIDDGHSDFPMMLQDYIPGPPTNHYFIDGFVDRAGHISALFARRRLRMHPPLLGNSTLMETVSLEDVEEAIQAIKKVIVAVKYRGIFSAEFKLDERDGLFKILEVNARPWWYIEFAGRCGVNICEMAYHDAMGSPAPVSSSYKAGRRCVYISRDYDAFHSEGGGRLLHWIASWLGADCTIFAWDDPAPGLFWTAGLIQSRLHRIGNALVSSGRSAAKFLARLGAAGRLATPIVSSRKELTLPRSGQQGNKSAADYAD